VKILLGVVLVALVLPGSAWAGSPPDRFDSGAAWRLVREQLSYGQRPAGSVQLQRLARVLRARLPNGAFEPLPDEPGLRNVVGTIPGRRPGIVIGAHYDTLADPPGFVGANNGAAGTAVVVEAARALAAMHLKAGGREIRFVLFDGEEPPSGLPEENPDFYSSGLRGSRAYVAAHPRRTAAMVLLDYVGNKDLLLPRERSSDRALWSRLRKAARAVGAGSYFPPSLGSLFLDDHTPFLRAGIPAVDLIDPNYDGHSTADRLDRLSRASVDAVGESIVALALDLR
jgi:glutaminyl-peptide cyclotransferase